jgi:hypothetical protein
MWSTCSRAENPRPLYLLLRSNHRAGGETVTIPGTARTLLGVGRLVAFAAALLIFVLMAWQGYDLFRYVFSRNTQWGEVGVLPYVIVLRFIVAGWVVWAVVRLEGRALIRVLLAAFGVSFLLLFGWYFLLLGMDGVLFYWIAAGDFLYLAGALLVGGASILSARTRGGESHA